MQCPYCKTKVKKNLLDNNKIWCELSCSRLFLLYSKVTSIYSLRLNDCILETTINWFSSPVTTIHIKQSDDEINVKNSIILKNIPYDITNHSLEELESFVKAKMNLLILQ